ncbi:MAG: helix-turn-helix domain-containing protein [Paracoccaceae bacterium]|nr:helix-turn-helix domain-containing protein [Paracoccaceae bacterium]
MTVHDAEKGDSPSKLKGFDDFELRLGDIMRGERATLGKSLLDVQRELKIKATYIAAIENSDPTAFETPGFIAGYVRSYARYLGLDAEWAYKTFCEEGNFQTAHGMSAEASVRRPRREAQSAAAVTGPRDPFTEPSVSFVPSKQKSYSGIEPRAVGSVFVLLLLIGGIGYGGWSVLQEVQKVRFTPVEQAPTVVADIETFEGGSAEFSGAPAAEAAGAPTVEAFDRLYRPQALDVPVLVARDGPIATLDPSRVGTLAPDPGEGLVTARLAPEPPAPEPVYGDSLVMAEIAPEDILPQPGAPGEAPAVQVLDDASPEVVLFAVRPAWVRVRAADGSVIFEKILDPGEEFTVPLTETPPTLRAGNAQSVFFRVNGVTYGPAGGNTSVVSNVALGEDELTGAYGVADLSRDEDLARYVDLSGGAAQ